jgi:hypothetical protein
VNKHWEQWIGFAALACASAAAHGGAYMRSEGELLHDVRVDYARADQEWDAGGATRATDCAHEHRALTTSLDYGFSYYLGGFAKLGLASTECDTVSESGPSDLSFGVRGRLDMFANNRSWELEAHVPARALGGSQALGCDAYGATLRVEARDEVVPGGFIGYGAGYRYWDSPLVPQAIALLSYTASIDRHARHPRWDWGTGLHGSWSLEDGDTLEQGPGVQIDCGSRTRVVRAALDVRYKVGLDSRVGCGVSLPVWGRDTRLVQGLSCVYSVLWE